MNEKPFESATIALEYYDRLKAFEKSILDDSVELYWQSWNGSVMILNPKKETEKMGHGLESYRKQVLQLNNTIDDLVKKRDGRSLWARIFNKRW